MERYYKCAEDSSVGKKLEAFRRKAVIAANKADQYANRMGASAYIQPAQYFEGGVDFLEFDKEPSAEVWRKKVLGDNVVYEPNCNVRSGAIMLTNGQKLPTDKWNRVYGKEPHFWSEVRSQYPLKYWALIVGYTLTGDADKDWAVIDKHLGGKNFLTYIEFSGDQKHKRGNIPSSLRKAVRAEKMRIALPVVRIEELFSILSFQVPHDKKDAARLSRSLVTPVFFMYDSCFYIEAQGECVAEGLVEIDKMTFAAYKKKAAIAAGLETEEDW